MARVSVQDWSPHMGFIWRILKFQPFSWKPGSNPRRQSKSIQMKYKTCIILVRELHWSMLPVQCEELRSNHLTLLLVVTVPYACWFLWRAYCTKDFKWRLHFQFGIAFWRGYFEGPNRVWRALKTWILNIGESWSIYEYIIYLASENLSDVKKKIATLDFLSPSAHVLQSFSMEC